MAKSWRNNAVDMNAIRTALLSDSTPMPEASASAGDDTRASRSKHVHPRLSATASGTLAANGEQTVFFTRSFSTKPAVLITQVESADNQPVIFKVKSWTTDGNGNYTGCVIKGYRMQSLPASILALTVLISFNVTAGSASGVEFSLIALQASS